MYYESQERQRWFTKDNIHAMGACFLFTISYYRIRFKLLLEVDRYVLISVTVKLCILIFASGKPQTNFIIEGLSYFPLGNDILIACSVSLDSWI